MRTEQLLSTLAAGFLIVAGCAGSESGESGTGGTSGGGAGGNSLSGRGGSMTGGSSGPGGAPGAGGTTSGRGGGSGEAGSNGHGGASGGSTGAAGASGGSTGAAGASGGSTGAAGASGGSTGAAGASGGSTETGGRGGAATGGRGGGAAGATGGTVGAGGRGGSTSSGTCTASKAASANASGSGPHKVTVETNSDSGIKEGTIFRPTDLGGTEKYPIFAWGEGACSLNGLSNSAAMAEIASHGYFVIADGTPNGSGSRPMNSSDPASMGKPLLAYMAWAMAENDKPCSAYYQSLDTTKLAANGFSCGGLMAEGTAGDPRITTWGINSSGLLGANQNFLKTVHTPVLIVLGGSGDIAYENGERDYKNLAALGIPILLFSKALGHGGDLFSTRGGDFAKIDLAWLNWQLKGDQTATGKGLLIGSSCPYCKDSAWEVKSMNIQ